MRTPIPDTVRRVRPVRASTKDFALAPVSLLTRHRTDPRPMRAQPPAMRLGKARRLRRRPRTQRLAKRRHPAMTRLQVPLAAAASAAMPRHRSLPADVTGHECSAREPMDCYVGPEATAGRGICHGGTRSCKGGKWEECVGQVLPQDEACNRLDDDCDGNVDEGTDVPCADGNAGCSLASDGTIACRGACRAGVKHCSDGVLDTQCSGQVLPEAKELCGAATAVDDNCDGATDEVCACSPGETQQCYNGPSETKDVGTCKHGTQTCDGGTFGPCMNEVGPVAETCMNEGGDDDCNTIEDDVPKRGDACTTAAQGICHSGALQCDSGQLRCRTAVAVSETCNMLDDDCDGTVDEGLLQTDTNNCGQCGQRCDAGQVCCAAQCVDKASDSRNCGTCGNACPSSASTCCAGRCVDAQSDTADCGVCAHACGTNELCCGGDCVSRIADDHCGSCTNSCSSLQTCCPSATCGILDALGICL